MTMPNRFRLVRPRLVWGTALMLLSACAAGEESTPAPAAAAVAAGAPVTEEAPLGEGFVVWESNRDGAWRIWRVDLAPGSEPRPLSPDEPGRVHCCPHLSPDGSRLAYLSLPPGGEGYKPGHTTGPLRLLDLGSGEERELAPAARTYFENRAVVWHGDDVLSYIDGEGRSRLLDLASGENRLLTELGHETDGWLVAPGLAVATRGWPSFSPYDRERRMVLERAARGGCQPYFSSDGRWGFWVAGAGGPVKRLDLASGSESTILDKADPRMIDGYVYAYFPMFSADGRAFAYAASKGEHSHVDADYEVFVAAADPATLELTGPVRRITHHPGTDRFPDVHLTPMPLGTHSGEAPFTLELAAPGPGWEWRFGDGATARGASGRHTYERPGAYTVQARRGGERLVGTVRVRPAAPPRIVAQTVAGGGLELRLSFDEEVATGEAAVSFASGRRVASTGLDDDGRTLVVRLAEPLDRFERVEVGGVIDRASTPNLMRPATLEIEPPTWPARRDAIFLWRTGDAPNLFFDAFAGVERAAVLEPRGRAFLDRHHRMILRGGLFSAGAEESNRLRWALQRTNEMALELTVEPAAAPAEGAIAIFGRAGEHPNFALVQRGAELFYRHRTGPHGAMEEAGLGRLAPGRRHLVLSYEPGRLTLDVDGERVADTGAIQADFFHWRSFELTIGGQAGGGFHWTGAAEGLALYDRVSTVEQSREGFARYRRLLERRSAAPRVVIEARLVESTPAPSLAQITPYRQALAVHEVEIERVVAGDPPGAPGTRLLVAHWALLDGERQPAAERSAGDRVTLALEPFTDQPQLAGVFVANGFSRPPDFFALDGG